MAIVTIAVVTTPVALGNVRNTRYALFTVLVDVKNKEPSDILATCQKLRKDCLIN